MQNEEPEFGGDVGGLKGGSSGSGVFETHRALGVGGQVCVSCAFWSREVRDSPAADGSLVSAESAHVSRQARGDRSMCRDAFSYIMLEAAQDGYLICWSVYSVISGRRALVLLGV